MAECCCSCRQDNSFEDKYCGTFFHTDGDMYDILAKSTSISGAVNITIDNAVGSVVVVFLRANMEVEIITLTGNNSFSKNVKNIDQITITGDSSYSGKYCIIARSD